VSIAPGIARITVPNPSIMTGPGTNTYLVGETDLVVIDPGPELVDLRELVVSLIDGRRVVAIAVTHHHSDHAPGARALADEVGAPVVGFGHAELDVDVVAVEGTELTGESVHLVAWHTPGHASDHLCFFEDSSGVLFTGDHVMQGSTVVIRPPDGDLTAYLDNVARVRDDARVVRLAPGHGRALRDPSLAASAILGHRAERRDLVLAALRDHGPATAAALRPLAYADVGADRDVVATATCWAHLLALVDEGKVTSSASREDPGAVFAARG
jgi:glyoxylase-like metal-dependent hydrolase (beta-lactamase superfamily II)